MDSCCERLLHLQVQGKHKQALETVEGKLGDVMSMAADRRSLRASLHVRLTLLACASAACCHLWELVAMLEGTTVACLMAFVGSDDAC